MTSYAATASASGWSWGATWTGGDDANEDEEDGEDYHGYVTGRDCLLLLVDCSAAMFEASDEDETAFGLSVRCCKTVLLNKIISSDKDLVGVVFFGTDKHKNPSDFKHVFIIQDLDLPDAPRIKQLDEFLEDSDLANSFQTEYGHNEAFSLSDVFWTCSNMFANMSVRAAHQRILLFTNNDNPHHSSLSLQHLPSIFSEAVALVTEHTLEFLLKKPKRQAKTKAKDLADAGIELELMHIQPAGGRHFDVSLFFQDLLFATSDDEGSVPDASTKFEELLTRVRSKEYAQRTLQRIPFSLAPDLEIGIGIYCMVREARKPSFVRLDRRSNEELKTQTKYLCDDTGNELMKGDMKYYQMFGGEKVIFDKEEVDQMKKFDKPGLVLIGFKPRSRLKRHHYIKPANFIYPDETVIQGSSKLFAALLHQCLARKVIAICRYIPRANASPVFVAMVPQEEELDQGVQISPPGFNLIFIPFASDFRNLTIEETAKANPDQIDAAKDVIKKLTFPFDSESFENPVLQKHFRTLEAIALEQPNAEEVNDLTVPDVENIERRAGPLLEKFKELVYTPDYDPEKGTKRKASSSAGGASKRAKISEGDDVNVEEHARNKTLNSLTIPILKNYLKSVGKKVTGKKQDLVDSINDHLDI